MSFVNTCFSTDAWPPTDSCAWARSTRTEIKMNSDVVNNSSKFRCIRNLSATAKIRQSARHSGKLCVEHRRLLCLCFRHPQWCKRIAVPPEQKHPAADRRQHRWLSPDVLHFK